MLRSGYVKKQEIPHEPGEWMDLRLLGWKDLDQARRARQGESFENIRQMGDLWKDIQKMQRELQQETGSDDAAGGDPLAQYDLGTVLKLGITGWSYDEAVNDETLGQLDPVTAQWAARIIVGVHAESEAERKNGSEPSISH